MSNVERGLASWPACAGKVDRWIGWIRGELRVLGQQAVWTRLLRDSDSEARGFTSVHTRCNTLFLVSGAAIGGATVDAAVLYTYKTA